MDMPEFARRFRESFPNLGASNRFIDATLSAVTMTPVLDIIALDDAIQAKYGETPDGTSMSDVVRQHYGDKAVAFVRACLDKSTGKR